MRRFECHRCASTVEILEVGVKNVKKVFTNKTSRSHDVFRLQDAPRSEWSEIPLLAKSRSMCLFASGIEAVDVETVSAAS